MPSAISQLSCFSTIQNRLHLLNRSRPHLLRSQLLTVMNSDQHSIKASSSGSKSAVKYTASASNSDNDILEKPYSNIEEYVNGEEIDEPVQVSEPKKAAKIHDFCFGIPYGWSIYVNHVELVRHEMLQIALILVWFCEDCPGARTCLLVGGSQEGFVCKGWRLGSGLRQVLSHKGLS